VERDLKGVSALGEQGGVRGSSGTSCSRKKKQATSSGRGVSLSLDTQRGEGGDLIKKLSWQREKGGRRESGKNF